MNPVNQASYVDLGADLSDREFADSTDLSNLTDPNALLEVKKLLEATQQIFTGEIADSIDSEVIECLAAALHAVDSAYLNQCLQK